MKRRPLLIEQSEALRQIDLTDSTPNRLWLSGKLRPYLIFGIIGAAPGPTRVYQFNAVDRLKRRFQSERLWRNDSNQQNKPNTDQPKQARLPDTPPKLDRFPGGSLLDVIDALAFLGIPDTPAARAWMHDEFAPMPADEFMVIPRREIEEFADRITAAITAARGDQ